MTPPPPGWSGFFSTVTQANYDQFGGKSGLKFDSQIKAVVKYIFFQLRQLAKIKPVLQSQHFETIIHAFVTTWQDYCNGLSIGDSGSSIARLQLVRNAAARLLTSTIKYEHSSPTVASLHW